MKKTSPRGLSNYGTGFFLPAIPPTRLFSVSLLARRWHGWSKRRQQTSAAESLVSVIVFFQLETKNRTVPFFIFRLCSCVAGSLCRWNLAGNCEFFVRGTLRQSFAELSLTYFKRCWYPNGVSSFGPVSAFLLSNWSKCTDFGDLVQTKKNMGIFFIAFFGFAFWGYARPIYKFLRYG